jgi:hypothetical protein
VTIFLHGADGYRRGKRLRILLAQFLAKYPGVGIRRVDGDDENAAARTAELLGSASLFSPRILVVLSDALALPAGELARLADRTSRSETQHLILVADADKLTKPYARLQQDDVIQEPFPVLAGADWAQFLAREAAARGIALTKQHVQQLAYAFPGDSWGVATELDVLAATPEAGRPARITETSRRAPLGSPGWGELRKLGSGYHATRLTTLARIEASGDAAAKTFAMAAYTADPRVAAACDIAVKTGGFDHEEAILALAIQ